MVVIYDQVRREIELLGGPPRSTYGADKSVAVRLLIASSLVPCGTNIMVQINGNVPWRNVSSLCSYEKNQYYTYILQRSKKIGIKIVNYILIFTDFT